MSCLLTDSTLSAVMASSTLMENLSGKGRWSGSLVFATVGKLVPLEEIKPCALSMNLWSSLMW